MAEHENHMGERMREAREAKEAKEAKETKERREPKEHKEPTERKPAGKEHDPREVPLGSGLLEKAAKAAVEHNKKNENTAEGSNGPTAEPEPTPSPKSENDRIDRGNQRN